jgi:hypothetical protein
MKVIFNIITSTECHMRNKSKTTIALNNNKPLTVLHEDVPRWATGERNKGKSQTVFLLSNVDQVATLEPKTAKNFQIENFQIISDIKPDYSPIFVGLSHIKMTSTWPLIKQNFLTPFLFCIYQKIFQQYVLRLFSTRTQK